MTAIQIISLALRLATASTPAVAQAECSTRATDVADCVCTLELWRCEVQGACDPYRDATGSPQPTPVRFLRQEYVIAGCAP